MIVDSITFYSNPFFQLMRQFCLFQLASSVNLICCQKCMCYRTFGKKRCAVLPEGTDVHIWKQINQKELISRVKQPPDIFQNVKTVQQQGHLISISSKSSKNHLLIKVLHIQFNLYRRFLVPSCSECLLISDIKQCNFIMS